MTLRDGYILAAGSPPDEAADFPRSLESYKDADADGNCLVDLSGVLLKQMVLSLCGQQIELILNTTTFHH